MKKSVKKWGKVLFLALSLAFVIEYFGTKGFLGWCIIIFGFAGWKAIKKRDQIKWACKHIESMIWGKSLDKKLWQKGEMKNTKLKFVWRRGDKDEDKT